MTDWHQRQKPGPGKPLTAQRELYIRLMKQGLNNSEACRLVGIHRSTGQHWRHGRRLDSIRVMADAAAGRRGSG